MQLAAKEQHTVRKSSTQREKGQTENHDRVRTVRKRKGTQNLDGHLLGWIYCRGVLVLLW